MQYVSFRGITSADMGLLVVDMPNHQRAQMRHTEYEIPGRNGSLHVNEGYAAFDMTVIFGLFNQGDIQQKRAEIDAWLSGNGKLFSSDDPDHAWDAAVLQAVVYDRQEYFGRYYDTITVRFRCQPVMHETTPTYQTFTSAGTFSGMGTVDALPKLIIRGVDDCTVTINGTTIYLSMMVSGFPVIIDCEAGYIHAEQSGTTMTGEFPILYHDKTNTISMGGGTASVQIQFNWGWI